MVLAGYGMISTGATGIETSEVDSFQTPGKHAGLNRIDAVYLLDDVEFLTYDFDNGLPEQNALAFDDVDSDLGLGDDEAMPGPGDSGGPVFLDGAIAGVIAVGRRLQQPGIDVTDEINSSWGEAHFDTRVATFQHFLIDATDDAVMFDNLIGDFDQSGHRDVADIDLLTVAQQEGSTEPAYDFDGSGVADSADRLWWIHNLQRTYLGDTNLDGQFNSDDLVGSIARGKYATDTAALWSDGDWNGDGSFDAEDLMDAMADGGYEQGPRVAASAVPEPCGALLLTLGMLVADFRCRRQRNAA